MNSIVIYVFFFFFFLKKIFTQKNIYKNNLPNPLK